MNAALASGLHYAISIGGPLALIALAAPASPTQLLLAGLLGWFAASFAEYALHRYVMHGMRRFAPAHALHHARPAELQLDAVSYFAPFGFQGAAWLVAYAVTLEPVLAHAVLAGATLQYSHFRLVHGLLHRERPLLVLTGLAAFHRRHHLQPDINFGVSVRFWDRLFGTALAADANGGARPVQQPSPSPFAPPPDLPLTIHDPCPVEDAPRGVLERCCAAWLLDVRDLAFVRLGFRAGGVLVPLAVLLYLLPPWLAGLLGLPYLWLLYARFGGPVLLMMHALFHRRSFTGPGRWLDRFLRHGLPMLYGLQPFAYVPHHLLMHHHENNGDLDLSSTLGYRRDDWRDFLRYWVRFMLGDNLRLARYLLARRRERAVLRYLAGSFACLAIVAGLMVLAPVATLVVFVLPYFLTRFFLMAGNWAQHAFIDPENMGGPRDGDGKVDLGDAVILVNATQNQRCFNDGYHAVHHRHPGLHWAEMAARFQADWRYYAQRRVLVFDGIPNTQVIWWCLMRRNYAYLAGHLAGMGYLPRDQAGRIALLEARTRPIYRAMNGGSGSAVFIGNA